MKTYTLGKLTPKELAKLRKTLVELLKGVVEMMAHEKVDETIEKLKSIPFSIDDRITISFPVEMNGGQLLAVIGRRKIKSALNL